MLKLQEKMILLLPSIPSPQAKLLVPIVVILVAVQLLVATVAAGPVALPGCPEACGSVTVPYPFGFRQGCFHKGFKLTCNETRHAPKLLLGDGVEVDAISLTDGTVRVQTKMVAYRPRDTSGVESRPSINYNHSWYGGLPQSVQLKVSTSHNIFVAIGCNFIAYLIGLNDSFNGSDLKYVRTCSALCDRILQVNEETSCSGVGCCRTTIAEGFTHFAVKFKDLDDLAPTDARPLVSAFIVDGEWFAGTIQNNTLHDFGNGLSSVPTVLEWWLDVENNRDLVVLDHHSASGWRCKSLNSFASSIGAKNKVRCNCSKGYEGNPYIVQGCQDVDECQQPVGPCLHGTCINMRGTYRCSTEKSIISLPGLIIVVAITASFGLLFSLLGVAKITNKFKRRRAKNLRQKFFKKNHGLLLQQLISSNKDIAERTRIFSLEELKQSTNKFDHNRILGGGGHGTVYKGILSDQRIVAIKKAKIIVQREIEQFINEVVILSQTNHRMW